MRGNWVEKESWKIKILCLAHLDAINIAADGIFGRKSTFRIEDYGCVQWSNDLRASDKRFNAWHRLGKLQHYMIDVKNRGKNEFEYSRVIKRLECQAAVISTEAEASVRSISLYIPYYAISNKFSSDIIEHKSHTSPARLQQNLSSRFMTELAKTRRQPRTNTVMPMLVAHLNRWMREDEARGMLRTFWGVRNVNLAGKRRRIDHFSNQTRRITTTVWLMRIISSIVVVLSLFAVAHAGDLRSAHDFSVNWRSEPK